MPGQPAPSPARAVARVCAEAGGRAWLVGGTVRDALLGRPAKDLDLEVHGLSPEALEAALARLGRPRPVGRSFGVFKLSVEGAEVDVALPKASSAAGAPGGVEGDPQMGIEAATRRRDLTINAMLWDPLTDELVDMFGGRADLESKILREVDPATFIDDPLRGLRVARFAATLGFAVAPSLHQLAARLPLEEVPGERIEGELSKILCQAPLPSVGMEFLQATGQLARIHPDLAGSCVGAPLDRAATARDGLRPPPRAYALMLAVWLHPLSQSSVQAVLERLRIARQGGYRLSERSLEAAEHGTHAAPKTDRALRELSEHADVTLSLTLGLVASQDPEYETALRRARELGVADGPLPPLVQGRDLAMVGVPQGPELGHLLDKIRAAQIEGRIQSREQAIALAQRIWSDRPATEP